MMEQRVCVPMSLRSVGSARRAVVRFAGTWFFGEQLADIEFAVGEALANSAEHGTAPDGVLDVVARFDGRQLTIEVSDGGPGFRSPNGSGRQPPNVNVTRGFGIFIMRRLMDEVEYGDQGRRVRLTKLLPHGEASGTGT